MASNVKKVVKKGAKKVIKKAKKNKGLMAFLVIVVLIVIGAFIGGYVITSPKIGEAKLKLVEVSEKLENEFESDTISNNIDLPIEIDGVKIEYTSSDENILSNSGKVNPPSYEDGDKTVTLKAKLTYLSSDALFNLYWGIFGGEAIDVTLRFTVKALEASGIDKINKIMGFLYVPSVTSCDIGLVKDEAIFGDVSISWTSSNKEVMTDDGKVLKVGKTTLKAHLASGADTKEVSFDVEVVESLPILEAINVDFNGYPKSTYASEVNKDNIVYVNSIFDKDNDPDQFDTDPDSLLEMVDKVMRMKATSSVASYFYLDSPVANPRNISFNYVLTDTTKINKDSYLNVYYSTDKESWNQLSSDKLTSNKVNYSKDLSLNGSYYFKVEFTTEYAELRLDLDDFKITREVSDVDVKKSLSDMMSLKFTSSRVLPQTTMYGGVVTWETSNSNLSEKGKVTKINDTQNITLTATINGFGSPIKVEFNCQVAGINTKTPVEMYFIDLGKYGLSDCGEAIYIKYGSFDFLIDTGDEVDASHRVIKETIDLRSEDGIIEYLLITHPDSDHVGGAPFILENYDVLNIVHFDGDHTSNLYRKFVAAVKNEDALECGAMESYNNEGDCKRIIDIDNDIYIEVLNTTHYDGKETNTRSVVCVLNAYGTRVLLTGDADNGSISTLEHDYMNSVGDIDILKVVHHGTQNGSTLEYLEAVDPEVAIICNGNYLGNKHGHPTPQAINRIYQYDSNIPIYAITGGDSETCTEGSSYRCEVNDATVDRNGTITILIDNNGYTISSENYGDNPLELSSTNYWKTNPWKEYTYQGK